MVASAHNCSMKSCSRQLEHGVYTSIVENGQAHRLGAVLMPSVDQVTYSCFDVMQMVNKVIRKLPRENECLQCVLVI